jgi:2-polyprenyl-6-methoxyphenol hydroxylase-like FAD-dependent oxidoreductase
MRQSQIIFEGLLKQIVEKEPLIQGHWGYTFQSLVESDDGVISTVHGPSGKSISIKSRYVIGCDGAGSQVRSSANIQSPRHTLYVDSSFMGPHVNQASILTTLFQATQFSIRALQN